MYNYYTYEKKKKQKLQKELENAKEKRVEVQHKILTDKLAKGYNKRIKKFILDLVKKPIIIQDYISQMKTTREQMLQESENKEQKKAFAFGGYITEKERIKKYLEDKKSQEAAFEHMNSKVLPLKQLKPHIIYEQPKMRFKPRTELERIVDSINHYNYNKKNEEIVKKQIKQLDLDTITKKKVGYNLQSTRTIFESSTDSSQDICENGEIGQYRNKYIQRKGTNNTPKISRFKRMQVANKSMKELMSEYHYKTHFKGASELAGNLKNIEGKRTRNIKNKPNLGMSKTLYQIHKSNSASNIGRITQARNETMKEINKSLLKNFAEKFPIGEENADLMQMNPLLYNLNLKTPKNENEKKGIDNTKKLLYLKKLAEKGPLLPNGRPSRKQSRRSIRISGDISNDEDYGYRENDRVDEIVIDNEMIPVTKIDYIAGKILRKCNYIHHKSKSNNTELKKGEGKLMSTSGMTINDFTSKYSL